MKTQTIEVEVLPEGWKAVAYRSPKPGEYFFYKSKIQQSCKYFDYVECLIVEKIQPRMIVLEQLRCDYKVMPGEFYGDEIAGFGRNNHVDEEMVLHLPKTIWREVKETDIPLTNEEPKLSLSVDECRNVRSLIKDFENLGWFVNPARSLLLQKITEFIKDK